jgi:hypothetical protein
MTSTWRFASGDRSSIADALIMQLPVVGKALLMVLDLLAVRDAPRAIGGEIPTDDGQFVVGLGERLHASVVERYRGEHTPDNVKAALAAEVPLFHERAAPRQSCEGEPVVGVDDDEAVLVDRSAGGVGIKGTPWLQQDARCRVALDGERWGARVAWTNGDRAGLALMYKLRQRGERRPALA